MRITRERLIAGALGYKCAAMLDGESGQRLLAERQDKARPLTVAQVRHTLDALEANGHFARCQASKRTVYFSNRLSRTEVREQLFKWKERAACSR